MFLGALVLLLSLNPPASADQWTKTFTINGPASVKVETSDADVRIDTWDRGTIEADVTAQGYKIGDGGIRITDQQNGNAVDINLKFPIEVFHINFHRRSVNIVLHVPKSCALDVHTGDGSIDVANTDGDMKLRTGDGHLHLSGTHGSMVLNTGDGRIEAENIDGTLQAHTGDGKVNISGRFDGLDVKTGDGSIDATATAGSRMVSPWTLHTNDGRLNLKVPDNFSAEVYVHTGDGHIDMQFPVSVYGRVSTNELHGKLNGGGQLLTLRSGDGSISLAKY